MALIFISAILTVIVLILGLFALAKGGKLNEKFSNRLMTLRVIFQAVTIILLFIFYLIS